MYTSPIDRTPSPGRHVYLSSGIASARLTDFFSKSSSDLRISARNPLFGASVAAVAAGAAGATGAALALAAPAFSGACAAKLMDASAIAAQHSNTLFIVVLLYFLQAGSIAGDIVRTVTLSEAQPSRRIYEFSFAL